MSQAPGSKPDEIFVASHDVLFAEDAVVRCDACGERLGSGDDSGGYGVPGSGAYLWVRGDEVTVEDAPLCASCASAIGVTALARWEIEEDEG
jgi:hypothetical protein